MADGEAEQPHLADDCDSDVEMPNPRATDDQERGKDGKLKAHLNVMLSEASHLTTEQRKRAEAFLWENRDVFVGVDGKVGVTGLTEHTIEVEDSPPIRSQPYRRSPKEKEELDKTIDGLLKEGKIEPSGSPWAAPVVMVQKKDGTMRFCVDYRKINAVTKKDAYPLPRIDDALDSLGGSNWFHTLDLASGYWQVAMATKAKEKTAFSTHRGLFQWTVMPFGLCNAPATFERLMEGLLGDIQWKHCLVYLDDIIVFGNSFEVALHNLNLVFQRLRKAGLKLKPSKCFLFRQAVEYLGHIVTKDGIQPCPS